MIPELSKCPVPEWLNSAKPLGDIPIREILHGSAFYPASWYDWRVISLFAGHLHSFVYVDLWAKKDELIDKLDDAFYGYEVVFSKSINFDELLPKIVNPDLTWKYPYIPIDRCFDDDPRLLLCHGYDKKVKPFCKWVVFERMAETEIAKPWRPDYDSYPRGGPFKIDNGPERFCLLYIYGEGASVFQNLYYKYKAAPAAVAIVLPGGGYPGFMDSRKIFARSVLQIPHGRPRYFVGEFYCSLVDELSPEISQSYATAPRTYRHFGLTIFDLMERK